MALKLPEYDIESLYPNHKTLSSSQVLCYEKDPAQFYTEYVLGARRKTSPAMYAGLIFSELHRDRGYNYREALIEAKVPAAGRIADLYERVIRSFPIVQAEYPLICTFGKWKFRATLDGFSEDYIIIENKTGQVEWNQERVNFDDQLTFQAWVHWKKFGIIPKRILLNWVNTKPKATKPLLSFRTTRSVTNLKRFEQRIALIIENIEAENWSRNIYV